MSPHPPTRLCRAAFVLPVLLFSLLVCGHEPAAAQSGFTCSAASVYTGRDKAVLSYNAAGDGITPLMLEAVHGDGTVYPVDGGAVLLSNTRQIAGLKPGAYTLRLQAGTACTMQAPLVLDGASLQGTPLFGDVISGGVVGFVDVQTSDQSGSLVIDNVTFQHSGLGLLNLTNTSSGSKISVTNSTNPYGLQIAGNGITLRNNVLGRLTISQRSNAVIEDNILLGPIELWGTLDPQTNNPICGTWCIAGPDPQIARNSFVGQYALRAPEAYSFWTQPIHHRVPVGPNFYGSALGYTAAVDNTSGAYQPLPFLAYTGAYVDLKAFAPATPLQKGRFPPDTIPPIIWAENRIWGQNVLSHAPSALQTAIAGRETFLSVDVRSTREELKGAKFWALFDGERVEGLEAQVLRGPVTYGKGIKGLGSLVHTVNFLLPAVPPTGADISGLPYFVYADLRSVPARGDLPDDLLLTAGSISLLNPPERKFRLLVFPVRVQGACSGVGTATGVVALLPGTFSAVGPLRTSDVAVTLGAQTTIECGSATSAVDFWTSANWAIMWSDIVSQNKATYDRYVAVIPKINSGWAIEGSNHAYNRTVLLLREDQPEAALHEFGHSLGLSDNYILEQKIDGLPLRGITAHNPYRNTVFGVWPAKHMWALEPTATYFDIMGSSSLMWPNWASYQIFYNYFRTFAGTAAGAANPEAAGARNAPAALSAATGARTLLFGAGKIFTNGRYYEIDMADAVFFDITGTGLNPGNVRELTWDTRFHVYSIEAYDSVGARVFQRYILPDDYWESHLQYNTLAVPDAAVRLELHDDMGHTRVWHRQEGFTAALVSPKAGTHLTQTLTLAWEQSSENLSHMVLYSTNGGATWDLAAPPFQGRSLDLDTSFLPVSSQIALRALTSDGFRLVETRVHNLVMQNRPPTARITFPPDGMTAPPGTLWPLAAIAGDLEDQTAPTPLDVAGTWASSLDGALDVDAAPEGVLLSPGTHTLTFRVQDSGGLAAQDQVHVTVSPVTAMDLALHEDSLRVLAAGYDEGIAGTTTHIGFPVTNTVYARVDGGGVAVTVTAAISVTSPNGHPVLLDRRTLVIAPFETATYALPLYAETGGEHLFSMAIEDSSLPDPQPANNRRTWSVSSWRTGLRPGHVVFLPLVEQQ